MIHQQQQQIQRNQQPQSQPHQQHHIDLTKGTEEHMSFAPNSNYQNSYGKSQSYSTSSTQQQQQQQQANPSQTSASSTSSHHQRQISVAENSPSSSYGYPYGYNQYPQPNNFSTQMNSSSSSKSGASNTTAGHFESHWPLYSIDWAHSGPSDINLLAVSTYTEDVSNKIQVIQAHPAKQQNGAIAPKSLEFSAPASFSVPYPCTRISWGPPSHKANSELMTLITTGDCLRLWNYYPESHMITQRCALSNKAKYSYTPPITNFDWNAVDPTIIITSSIDTTCTIWDLSTFTARTQLIAHDSEVYDVAFVMNSTNVFGSVGADGSVRMFDQRALDHSTIIYDPPTPTPLVKIEANPRDANSLAILGSDTNEVYLIDIRMPGGPIATLSGHKRPINSIRWAPASATPRTPSSQSADSVLLRSFRHVLMTGSDDCQAIIWDTSTAVQYPVLASNSGSKSNSSSSFSQSPSESKDNYSIVAAYTHDKEINGVTWSKDGSWAALASGKGVQAISL